MVMIDKGENVQSGDVSDLNWPSLSIIIPVLNQGEYIERALLSVLKQKYEGELQVIVADGGSTDSTIEILKKYPQIIWWSKPDKGSLDADLEALEVVTGEIIAILPGDDFYLRDAFKKTIPFLIGNPEIAFVSGAFVVLKENKKDVILPAKQSCRISSPLEYITGEVSIPLQFIRRSAYDKVGGFRREAEQCCDFDLLYRMLHFFTGLIIPEYISVFQLRTNQATRLNSEKWITSMRLVIEDCEREERYFRVFKPTGSMKREVDLKNQIFWNDYAGGLEGRKKAKFIAGEILAQKEVYSRELVKYAKSFFVFSNQSIAKKIMVSIFEGSIIKEAKKFLLHKIDKLFVDINWWQT